MRKRTRIQSLSLCVGGLALTGFAGQALAQNVSGNLSTTTVNYGANVPGTGALATQTINTSFGNSTDTGTYTGAPAGYTDANGSELDAAYGTISNGYLYLFLSGNIENNGNMLDIFFDDGRSGGQNTLEAPQGAGTMQAMNGSIFSPGFDATYAVEINDYHGTAYLDEFDLLPGGEANYVGDVSLNNDGIGSSQNIGKSIKLGINNTNISTMGTSGQATSTSAAQSVSTGIEVGIPLSLLGDPTGNVEVMADINGNGDTYLSNQFLPGMPVGTGSLGDGTETYSLAGNTGGFNLSTTSNFWITIPNTTLANGIWLPDTSGSWATSTNWSNGYIPGVAGDSASFANATAAATVTLDGNRTVGSITFNSSSPYTIAPGTGGKLTLDNGGASATATITDDAGNQFINVPVVLNSNAVVSANANGSNLTISGNITGVGSLTTSSQGINGRTNTTSDVILSGDNTYSGGTTISEGVLQLESATALPTNTSLVMDGTNSPEATLDLNGFNLTLAGLTTNTGSGGNTQIENTNATAGTATLTFAGTAANPITYPGNIFDSSSTGGNTTAITVASGSVELTGTNTYAGNTTVNSGATLNFYSSTAAGSTFPVGGNVTNNGTLLLNDNVNAGAISGSGTTTIGAGLNVTVTTLNQTSVDNEGDLTVYSGGTVGKITETGTAGALAIYAGTLQLAQNSGASNQSVLYIAPGASLDITNNSFFIDYGSGPDPISSVIAEIQSAALNGGSTVTWQGTGITSSLLDTANAGNSAGSYGIGYADSADLGNPAGLSSGTIEIMYTLLGDANLDGKVNGADFAIMAANFNQGGKVWDQGDFNYDGNVNGADFTLLAKNFNQSATQSAVGAADLAALEAFAAANGISLTTSSVPEPASVALMVVAGLGILKRRRRTSREC
jgi:fibronectin-binding autotransporter adhesin